MKFDEFLFDPLLQKAIVEMGFVDCTPVQAESFQAYFAQKDIYAQSQTGTGKTAAFILCGLQELIIRNKRRAGNLAVQENKHNEDKSLSIDSATLDFAADIKMLILSPTRELAEQIEQESRLLTKFLPVQVAAFYGGVGYEKQRLQLDQGVQIITGTPGRVIDLAKSGKLLLNQVQVMVLDEADRMLDMGFIQDICWLMGELPPAAERLTMLYSATLNAKVGNLSWDFLRSDRIGEIVIEPEQITTKNVEQELYHIDSQKKLRLLLSLIKKYEPNSALIFCNTKNRAIFVEKYLQANGYRAKALIGDLPQVKRTQTIGQLKAGKLRFVVCTDIASRGLHIEGLPLVINYDLPNEAENYVHRIGRTARAGAKGKAISFACERYVYNLSAIELYLEEKIPVQWLAEEELVEEPKIDKNRIRESRASKKNIEQKRHSRNTNRHKRQEHETEKDGERKHREHKNYQQDKSGRNRSRNAKAKGTNRKVVKKSNFSQESREERIKYYQQKYGEDFQIALDTNKGQSKGPNKSNRGYKKANWGTAEPTRAAVKDTGPEVSGKNNPPVSMAEPTGPRPESRGEQPQKKTGLFQRLFGRKKR